MPGHRFQFIRIDLWLLNPRGRLRSSTDAHGRVITRTNAQEQMRSPIVSRATDHPSPITPRSLLRFLRLLAAIVPSRKKSMRNWRESPQISATYRKSKSPPTPQTTCHGRKRSRTPNPTVSHSIRPNDTPKIVSFCVPSIGPAFAIEQARTVTNGLVIHGRVQSAPDGQTTHDSAYPLIPANCPPNRGNLIQLQPTLSNLVKDAICTPTNAKSRP
jgi:hypothetical protein